jgi:hypothetical protein
MAITIQPPKPGDLITAEFMKQLIGELKSLDLRVTALEGAAPGSGALTITTVLPSATVRIGDTVHLLGSGFGLPSENDLSIGNTSIPKDLFQAGSDDSHLAFVLPPIDNVGTDGAFKPLLLTNARGTARTTLFIQPPAPSQLGATFNFSLTDVPPGNLIPQAQPYAFGYTISLVSNMDERFIVTPVLQPAQGTPAGAVWTARVLDSQGSPQSSTELSLPKSDPPAGSTRKVSLQITVPQNGTSAQLSLRIDSNSFPNMTWSSPTTTLTVNQQTNSSGPILFSLNAPPAPFELDSNGILRVPATNNGQPFIGTLTFSGTPVVVNDQYIYSPAPAVDQSAAADWTVKVLSPAPVIPGTTRVQIRIAVQATSANSKQTTLSFKLIDSADGTQFGTVNQVLKAKTGT